MHRNTFLNSPKLLSEQFFLRSNPDIYFAGQITGVEGYIESAASGIFAGLNMARAVQGKPYVSLPETSMLGALSKYISNPTVEKFQPMGCNIGILPPLSERIRDKKQRYEVTAQRGLADLDNVIEEIKL
jgi:methylenetetrahydrofolate--tRNA-(uracil-5-)-methyltransferase